MEVESNSDMPSATLTLASGATVGGQGTIGNYVTSVKGASNSNLLIDTGTIAANVWAGETLALNIDFTEPRAPFRWPTRRSSRSASS